jgi:hypothetical protein
MERIARCPRSIMTAIFPDAGKFQYLDPQQVETYLAAHGWQQATTTSW